MAKNKGRKSSDTDALASDVADLEALVKRRKAAQRALEALDNGDDLEGGDDMAPLPGSELVDQVLAELGGDGGFSVTKLDGGEVLDCGTFDLPLWPDAMRGVIEKNGGGSYVLIFRGPDGKIAKRIKRTYPGGKPAQAAAQTPSGDLGSFMKIMSDERIAHEKSMSEMRLEMARQSSESMKMVLAMVTAQNKPMVNNAAELATIAKLFGAGEKKGNDLSDLVALKDLLDDLRGDPEDAGVKIQTDSPLVALLAPILQALGKGLNAAPKPAPRAPSPVIEAPKPAPAAAVPPLTPTPPAAEPSSPSAAEASGLLQHAAMLKTAIEAGVTPDFAAARAWEDALSKGLTGELEALIEKGDWTGLKAHADLSSYGEWLDAFRVALRNNKPAVEAAPAAAPIETEANA